MASRDVLAAAFDAVSHPLAILDAEGVIVMVNEAWLRFALTYKLDPSSAGVGASYLETWRRAAETDPVAAGIFSGILDLLAGKGQRFEIDYPYHSLSEPRWFRLCAAAIPGPPPAVVIEHVDITQLKAAAEAHQQDSQKLRAILDQTFQFIGFMTPDGTLIDANETALRFSGVDKADVVNRPFWEGPWWRHSPELQGQLRDAVRRAAAGEFIRFEATHPAADGSLHWVDFSLKPVRDEAGNVIYLIPEGRDITERKQTEQQLRVGLELADAIAKAHDPLSLARRVLRLVCEGLQWDLGMLWLVEPSGEHLRCISVWTRSRAEHAEFEAASRNLLFEAGVGLPGRTWQAREVTWVPEMHPEPTLPRTPLVTRLGPRSAAAFPMLIDDKVLGVLDFFAGEVRERDPELVRMFTAIGQQLGQFFERLRAERHFQELLEAAPDAMVLGDHEGRIEFVNRQAETLLGRKRWELIGQPIELVAPPSQREPYASALREVLADPTIRHLGEGQELCVLHSDGREIPVEISLARLDTRTGPAIMAAIRDVSRRKVLERQLSQAQRLEALGQLVAGVAHEMNTPLQYVGDSLHFLNEAFTDLTAVAADHDRLLGAARENSTTTELLRELERSFAAHDVAYLLENIPRALISTTDGVARVAEIVRAMKQFSHPGTQEKAPIDLNQTIRDTITVSRNEWKYVAEVVLELDPAAPPVPCREGELRQVLLNLIINAAHAVADVPGVGEGQKGTITVSTRCEGPWAEIRIRDTGVGIPESIHDRIFEPFFTTKEVGRGTGQGLAIVHSIVVQGHGGSVSFESAVGEGTTFLVRLPLVPSLEKVPAAT